MKTLSNSKGFSLIELMIVVAIIGILSAVAIPNFQKFQLKSRQSEAKTNLAGLYQVQKAFHQEWSQYFSDWRDLGFAPEGTMKYDYANGNGATAIIAPSAFSGYMGVTAAGGMGLNTKSLLYCVAMGGGDGVCYRDTDYLGATTNVEATGADVDSTAAAFTASAVSDIDRDIATVNDIWIIDQTKNLQNTQLGF